MRRKLMLGLAAAGIAAAGVAGGVAGASLLDDDEVELAPITVAAETSDVADTGSGATTDAAAESGTLVAEDGIAAADARRIAGAATDEVPGTAISVESDDGLYGVDVRDRSGAIVEVLVDQSGRVVGLDRGDD